MTDSLSELRAGYRAGGLRYPHRTQETLSLEPTGSGGGGGGATTSGCQLRPFAFYEVSRVSSRRGRRLRGGDVDL